MIVVIDTNVFVSACMGSQSAAAVIAACLRGQLQPLMGAALFAEMEDVLGRSALFANCRLTEAERDELLDVYMAHCRWTQVFFGWRPNLRDEGDNHIVELAVAGAAAAIITQNIKDFRQPELTFPSLRVLAPAELLKELAG